MRQDVEFLAGRLPHRGANTENERLAAEYIHERLKTCTSHAEIDDFYSINTYHYLFASYYAEFLIVTLLAIWFPWFAFAYGAVIFLLYIAEFTGYATLGRLMPHYETQNVIARFLSRDPRRLLIITANYDSPKAGVLTHPQRAHLLRRAHLVLVLCMTVVIVTCAVDAMALLEGSAYRADLWARWLAVTVLIAAALTLYTSESNGDFVRGANNNASGVAILLNLAERLRDNPLKTTDVWLVATGGKETWLSGMRHLLKNAHLDKSATFFLNVAHVGGGTLRYATGEGMMHVYPASRELTEAARHEARAHLAEPLTYRGLPTDALIPLARGYKTLGIMATGENGLPKHWNRQSDTASNIDYPVLASAADYVEAISRRLDASDEA